jgi:hypothetical protein
MVVMVPVSADALARLSAGQPVAGPLRAYAASSLLLQTFDLSEAETEQAERTALQVASLDALVKHGRRLVVVTRAPYTADPDGYLGQGTVTQVTRIEAVFADAAEAGAAVRLAYQQAAGKPLDEAWDLAAVRSLLVDHDLLWFGAEEASSLLGLAGSPRPDEDEVHGTTQHVEGHDLVRPGDDPDHGVRSYRAEGSQLPSHPLP